jgi:hypothetical protein
MFKMKDEKKKWINTHFLCAKHSAKNYHGPSDIASESKILLNSEIS